MARKHLLVLIEEARDGAGWHLGGITNQRGECNTTRQHKIGTQKSQHQQHNMKVTHLPKYLSPQRGWILGEELMTKLSLSLDTNDTPESTCRVEDKIVPVFDVGEWCGGSPS